MNGKIPRTPISTALSGSAKETEIRLKNIFAGPKKRPPLLFLALMFSVCVFCGNLVSCQTAGTEGSDRSIPDPPDASNAVQPEEDWQPVTLENSITSGSFYGSSEAVRDEPRFQILLELPVDELPQEAVEIYRAGRQDYWRDMLLPVAADEESDTTLYFVVDPDSMPDDIERTPMIQELTEIGIVLRHGDQARFLDLVWETHWKYSTNPWLAVEDFDGDGEPEIATALGWGTGTGADAQCLYILDLQEFDYPSSYPFQPHGSCAPNYDSLQLDIFSNLTGTKALMVSGDQKLEIDLTELGGPFDGTAEVGSVVRFTYENGQIYCHLDPDFGILQYPATASFPVIYEEEEYRLGPAVSMSGGIGREY